MGARGFMFKSRGRHEGSFDLAGCQGDAGTRAFHVENAIAGAATRASTMGCQVVQTGITTCVRI